MQITINKVASRVDVDYDKLPENSQAFVINYGIRQILNDCHSAISRKDFKTDEEFIKAVMEAVNAKLSALATGDLSIRRGGSAQPLDPIAREVLRIAKDEIKTALRTKKALSIKAYEAAAGEGAFDKLVASHIEKSKERLEKTAKANLKKLSEAAPVDIDELLA